MHDLKLHLDAIEKLMQLMERYGVEELAVDFVNIKRANKLTAKIVPQDALHQEALDKHLNPSPDNPWDALAEEDVESWSRGRP